MVLLVAAGMDLPLGQSLVSSRNSSAFALRQPQDWSYKQSSAWAYPSTTTLATSSMMCGHPRMMLQLQRKSLTCRCVLLLEAPTSRLMERSRSELSWGWVRVTRHFITPESNQKLINPMTLQRGGAWMQASRSRPRSPTSLSPTLPFSLRSGWDQEAHRRPSLTMKRMDIYPCVYGRWQAWWLLEDCQQSYRGARPGGPQPHPLLLSLTSWQSRSTWMSISSMWSRIPVLGHCRSYRNLPWAEASRLI